MTASCAVDQVARQLLRQKTSGPASSRLYHPDPAHDDLMVAAVEAALRGAFQSGERAVRQHCLQRAATSLAKALA